MEKSVGIGRTGTDHQSVDTEFSHRPAPDYSKHLVWVFMSTFCCQKIGASPLPILSCRNGLPVHSAEVVPLEQLDPSLMMH